MKKKVIKNGYILTMVDDQLAAGDHYFIGDILIDGNKITQVVHATHNYSNEEYEVIDATGMVVLPGFINCHTHAAMTLLRGYADDLPLMEWLEKKIWPLEDKLMPDYVHWGTKLAILEMIKGGTTCFADMYFMMDQVAEAVQQTGMRACLSRGIIAFNNGDKSLKESVDFTHKWHQSAEGRITAMLGPHAPYTCPPDFLEEVTAEAKNLGIGIHIHLAETLSEVKQLKEQYGKTAFEIAYDAGLFSGVKVIAAHCVYATDSDMELILKGNVGVAHNPESNMKLASGIAPVTKMLKAGITVGLGTDGAASNNNLDMIQEMRSAALLQKVHTLDPTVIPSYTALAMATKNGAKVLGLEKEIGTIQAGMKADIIILNLKEPHLQPIHDINAHLVYSASAADVDTVIIDGKVVMMNREVFTMDEERVIFEVNDIVKKLL
ncbi:MAG: amidohydrolase [Bacillota bacterium]